MSFPFSVIRKADSQLRRVGAEVPEGYYDISVDVKQQEWNGIGSDKGVLKILVMPTNFLLPWMLAASLPHDILWGVRNDGTRETFERSKPSGSATATGSRTTRSDGFGRRCSARRSATPASSRRAKAGKS